MKKAIKLILSGLILLFVVSLQAQCQIHTKPKSDIISKREVRSIDYRITDSLLIMETVHTFINTYQCTVCKGQINEKSHVTQEVELYKMPYNETGWNVLKLTDSGNPNINGGPFKKQVFKLN